MDTLAIPQFCTIAIDADTFLSGFNTLTLASGSQVIAAYLCFLLLEAFN